MGWTSGFLEITETLGADAFERTCTYSCDFCQSMNIIGKEKGNI